MENVDISVISQISLFGTKYSFKAIKDSKSIIHSDVNCDPPYHETAREFVLCGILGQGIEQ